MYQAGCAIAWRSIRASAAAGPRGNISDSTRRTSAPDQNAARAVARFAAALAFSAAPVIAAAFRRHANIACTQSEFLAAAAAGTDAPAKSPPPLPVFPAARRAIDPTAARAPPRGAIESNASNWNKGKIPPRIVAACPRNSAACTFSETPAPRPAHAVPAHWRAFGSRLSPHGHRAIFLRRLVRVLQCVLRPFDGIIERVLVPHKLRSARALDFAQRLQIFFPALLHVLDRGPHVRICLASLVNAVRGLVDASCVSAQQPVQYSVLVHLRRFELQLVLQFLQPVGGKIQKKFYAFVRILRVANFVRFIRTQKVRPFLRMGHRNTYRARSRPREQCQHHRRKSPVLHGVLLKAF